MGPDMSSMRLKGIVRHKNISSLQISLTQEMKPQAYLRNVGLESTGQQKVLCWNLSEPQILCQYKFYPTYLTSKAIQMKVEDVKCNEAASRFIVENRTELQQGGLVG
ncbi:hypothetical protein Fmac_013454 [Flemingia macrophylla]|uniref:Uncharacterized protein n=1 Tax=Flemingia macrophylla TaxID=520843 RepID=A0ABD1MT63_9FABA